LSPHLFSYHGAGSGGTDLIVIRKFKTCIRPVKAGQNNIMLELVEIETTTFMCPGQNVKYENHTMQFKTSNIALFNRALIFPIHVRYHLPWQSRETIQH
jgi:hypothetical protein